MHLFMKQRTVFVREILMGVSVVLSVCLWLGFMYLVLEALNQWARGVLS